MLWLPAAIAGGRLAFHAQALAGHCALAGALAGALVYVARHYVGRTALQELLYLGGALLGAAAWTVWVVAAPVAGAFAWAGWLVPLAVWFIALGRLSGWGPAYRLCAAWLVAASSAMLILGGRLPETFTALGIAAGFLVHGCLARERETTLAAAALSAAALTALAIRALHRVDVASWMTLAVAGVLLVVGASLVERYGRTLAGRLRDTWNDVRQWRS